MPYYSLNIPKKNPDYFYPFTPKNMNYSRTTTCFLPIFGIAFLHLTCSSFSEKAPYNSFAKDATLAPPKDYYDYIIIGGGTSGCALAATLSQGAKVLLLERGGLPYNYPNINTIKGFASTLADVSPSSPSQPFISTDGVFNHRARVLGGGSALNAGFYTRAGDEYVKGVGWDEKLVNESFEWVEKKVAFTPSRLSWQTAVKEGLLEAGVLPDHGFTYEHLVGTKFGGTIFDENGRRHTAADLLEYADPRMINVHLFATVQLILFQTTNGIPKPRATGVIYRDSRGRTHKAYLNKQNPKNEIILSAGALGSPQLLMLSGIGAAQHLKAHKIRVLLDQPKVGQGMADNPMNILLIPSPIPVETSLIETVGITEFGSFIEAASGFIQFPKVNQIVQHFWTLADQAGYKFSKVRDIPGVLTALNVTKQTGVILEKIDGPFSSGNLKLKSNDPNDTPIVTFNYFKDPRDLEKCVRGMTKVLEVTGSRSVSKFRYPFTPLKFYIDLVLQLPTNLRFRHLSSTVSMEQFCIDTVMTIWHYHGGCRVNEVVDRDYKVVGVDALRVVDGSTFLASPGANPQATLMMLGRYVGQRILQERA